MLYNATNEMLCFLLLAVNTGQTFAIFRPKHQRRQPLRHRTNVGYLRTTRTTTKTFLIFGSHERLLWSDRCVSDCCVRIAAQAYLVVGWVRKAMLRKAGPPQTFTLGGLDDIRRIQCGGPRFHGARCLGSSYRSSGLMPLGLYCVFGGGAATATSPS